MIVVQSSNTILKDKITFPWMKSSRILLGRNNSSGYILCKQFLHAVACTACQNYCRYLLPSYSNKINGHKHLGDILVFYGPSSLVHLKAGQIPTQEEAFFVDQPSPPQMWCYLYAFQHRRGWQEQKRKFTALARWDTLGNNEMGTFETASLFLEKF